MGFTIVAISLREPVVVVVGVITVTLPSGSQIQYLVDGHDRRVGKKVNGSLVQAFRYDSKARPLAELDPSGVVMSRFVYGARNNTPDYIIKGNVTYRIITDHL